MNANLKPAAWLSWLALALAAGWRSCDTPETQLRPLGPKPQQYASAAITYRLQPTPVISGSGEVELASYTPQPAKPQRSQILSIEFPHPAGRPGYALAELIVLRDPAEEAARQAGGWTASLRRIARISPCRA